MPARNRVRRVIENVPDRADDFAKAFYGLKMVFAKYEKYLQVTADTREKYYLETRSPSYNGKPLFFDNECAAKRFSAVVILYLPRL